MKLHHQQREENAASFRRAAVKKEENVYQFPIEPDLNQTILPDVSGSSSSIADPLQLSQQFEDEAETPAIYLETSQDIEEQTEGDPGGPRETPESEKTPKWEPK